MPLRKALIWLVIGLAVLVGSSQLLVWGAVTIAQSLGVSDLVIGLTVLAVGTSLPELASCVAAARKGEHDIVLGNVLGSNLFNTLAVVGIAGAISPMRAGARGDHPRLAGDGGPDGACCSSSAGAFGAARDGSTGWKRACCWRCTWPTRLVAGVPRPSTI